MVSVFKGIKSGINKKTVKKKRKTRKKKIDKWEKGGKNGKINYNQFSENVGLDSGHESFKIMEIIGTISILRALKRS